MTNGQTSPPTVSLDSLFFAFLEVALCGLGSGIVWARRIWSNNADGSARRSLPTF
jgi:hypothetical protein